MLGIIIILGVDAIWDKRKRLDDFISLSERLSEDYQFVLVGLKKDQISNLYDKLDSMGIHIDLDSEEVQGFFSKIVEFIKDFLNRLG